MTVGTNWLQNEVGKLRNNSTLSTSDKLLLAAIDLIASKGYKGVTTQEIAATAGLSEKHCFGNLAANKICSKLHLTVFIMLKK